jgi:hypothetical protein
MEAHQHRMLILIHCSSAHGFLARTVGLNGSFSGPPGVLKTAYRDHVSNQFELVSIENSFGPTGKFNQTLAR